MQPSSVCLAVSISSEWIEFGSNSYSSFSWIAHLCGIFHGIQYIALHDIDCMVSFRAHQRSRRLVFLASIQLNHPCIKAESYSWSASGSVYGTVVKGRRPGARPSGMSPEVQMLLLVDVCSSESLPLLRNEYHFKRVYAQATRPSDRAIE